MYAGQEVTEPDMEQMNSSKLVKECIKAIYCHSAYLTYVQNTSWEMLDWMIHKLESRFLGEISNNFRYANDTSLMAESEEELQNLLMREKEEKENLA